MPDPESPYFIFTWVAGGTFIAMLLALVGLVVRLEKARSWVKTMIEEGREPVIKELHGIRETMTDLSDSIQTILRENVKHDGDLGRLKRDMEEARGGIQGHGERIASLEARASGKGV